MFMWSFRLSKSKILICTIAVVVVVSIGVIGVRFKAKDSTVAAPQTASQQTEEKVKPPKVNAKTGEQRLEFIRSFGWVVNEEPAEIMEVVIPKEFDDVYKAYNAMQKTQGFDLEKFAGKRCKRYSFVATNYPGATGEIRVNIIVCNDKIIGGDVCSLEVGGFMHGFNMPVK